jgi:hypothetical protein
VLGLVYDGDSAHKLVYGLRSERRENLLLFWQEVHRARDCITTFDARTDPSRMFKGSNISGKTVAEKRKTAAELLTTTLNHRLEHHCYPKLHYEAHTQTGEPGRAVLGWGFRSLLGAMYLQLAWRIRSRQCQAPGCSNVIGLHARSDKAV